MISSNPRRASRGLLALIFTLALTVALAAMTSAAGARDAVETDLPAPSRDVPQTIVQADASTAMATGETSDTQVATQAQNPLSTLAEPLIGPPAPGPEERVVDPLGRGTPRGLVEGFLDAIGKGDYDRASRYIDQPAGPGSDLRSRQLARQLETLLNRSGAMLPKWQISTAPGGHPDDGHPARTDQIGVLRHDGVSEPLLATRRSDPENGEIWLIAGLELDRVSQMLAGTRASLVDRLLPASLAGPTVFGAALSHWIVLAGLAGAAFGIAFVVLGGLRVLALMLWPGMRNGTSERLIGVVLLPFTVFVGAMIFPGLGFLAGVSVVARGLASHLVEIVAWASLAWMLWRIIEALSDYALDRLVSSERLGALSVVTMARRAGKVIIVAVALAAAFSTLGVNLTGWVAAFGIGGLAIALGAQKTIEHFVGSLTLIADQPVKIGDFCRVDTILGTIEDIGMRSTRIRTLDRTLVTIPNGMLSSAQIENYTARDCFRFHTVLGMRPETTPGQLRYLLVEIRTLLYSHARTLDDLVRVRFVGFVPGALNIEIAVHVRAANMEEFFEVREDLLLRIMEIIHRAGSAVAHPAQTVYFRRDAPDFEDSEKIRTAEDSLRRFSPEHIAKLKGTIPFNPEPATPRRPLRIPRSWRT